MNNNPSIYTFDCYKSYLRHLVEVEPKGFISKLAQAAGCQRSYMSEVLRSHIHLTPDHGDGVARYLRMDHDQAEYWLALILLARASTKHYRARLKAKIESLQQAHKKPSKRFGNQYQNADLPRSQYYSSWHYAAIHIATSISGLNSAPTLARHFRLPESYVEAVLAYLKEDGFVVSTGDGKFSYNYDRAKVYLPDDSVLTRLNHTNWRTLALTRPDQTPDDLHYSSVSAISRDDYPRFRQMLMDFIEEHRQQVADSGCEELMVFSCDMFSL